MFTFGGGGQIIITFYFFIFFVPFVQKIISRHYSFFIYWGRGAMGGTPSPPPWSMANIKHAAANITGFHCLANLSHSGTEMCFPKTHFILDLFKWKNTLFSIFPNSQKLV